MIHSNIFTAVLYKSNDFCIIFSDCDVDAHCKISTSASASKLAEVFPSLLTAEGKKSPEPEQPIIRSDTKSVEVLAEKMDENLKIDEEEPKKETNKKIKPSASAPSVASAASAACAAASAPKKATTAKELRDLMYQHYCVGKGKLKKPSANAIKKGKVPPPPCSSLQKANDESTDEMSEDEDEDDDTSSETSKATTTTASESHNKNGAHCNCCYCEVFGPGKNLTFFS